MFLSTLILLDSSASMRASHHEMDSCSQSISLIVHYKIVSDHFKGISDL